MNIERSRIDLLNSVQDVHKQDIKTYVSGHLSEVKLKEAKQEVKRRATWASSTKPPMRLKPASRPVHLPVRKGELAHGETRMKTMMDIVAEFGFGALGGSIFGPSSPTVDKENGKNTTEKNKDRITRNTENCTFIEELKLPEIMLHSKKKGAWLSKGNTNTSPDTKHEFVKSHLGYVTKGDQYDAMKNFEKTVMNLPDASEKGLLTGERIARKLQKSLNKKIRSLHDSSRRGPNFHRLQAYSDCFSQIVDQSTTFSRLLKMIKDEYDSYLTYILDQNNVSQHRDLFAQMPSLTKAKSVAENVKEQQETLENLEEEVGHLLNENERLRKCLKEEKKKPFLFTPLISQNVIKTRKHIEEFSKDFQEQVEDLHSQIADQLQTLEKMRKYQRENCVPSSVCHHFEHCVKETDVDIQKLLKQNEFLEQSIEELESELETMLSSAESSRKLGREHWKKKLDISRILEYGRSKKKEN